MRQGISLKSKRNNPQFNIIRSMFRVLGIYNFVQYKNFTCPQGIHVAHVIIDGAIDTEFIKKMFPDIYSKKDQNGILDPESIAEAYWQIHLQKRSAWTQEMDLRPWMESF